jgi:hypothetical protein
MVAHTCNPSTWEAQGGELRIPGQPGLKRETLSQNKQARRLWLMPIILAAQEAEIRRIVAPPHTSK